MADKKKAIAKLKEEVKEYSKQYGRIINEHLIPRVKDSDSLAESVLESNRSVGEMGKYIFALAKKEATNNMAIVEDDTVFEWAEDYFRATNEQLVEVGIRSEKPSSKPSASTGKARTITKKSNASKTTTSGTKTVTKVSQNKPKTTTKSKAKSSSDEEQISLF